MDEPEQDGRAIAFSNDIRLTVRQWLGLGLFSVTVFTLAPVLQARGVSLARGLSARTTSDRGRSRVGMGHLLVVLQVALALVVIVAAALLSRTLVGLRSADLGFDRRNLLLVWAQPTSTGRQGQDLVALWRDTQAQLLTVPGVVSASSSNTSVVGGGNVPTAGPAQQLSIFLPDRRILRFRL